MAQAKFSLTLAGIMAVTTAGPFATALRFALNHEGVYYEDVPGDPGGPTCCGITHADYDAYRHEHGQVSQPVNLISAEEVAGCYREHYWRPLKCDSYRPDLALAMFDAGVNVGIGRAVRWLQTALGVTVDGNLGPNTMASVAVYTNKHGSAPLAAAILRQRQAYYKSLGAWADKFKTGWLARCSDLQTAAGISTAA